MSFCSVDLTPAAVSEALLHRYPAGGGPLPAINEKFQIKKKSYVFINFLYAFYSIIFTVVIPALPVLTLKICNDNSSRASLLYGTANFVRYISEFIASPFMGSMADYSGRRPLLMTAFLICGVEFILLALFPSVPMLYLTRSMAGIGDCAQAVCYTITTDIAVYNKDTVTHIFGVLAGMYGLGFVVGPLLGGLLTDYLDVQTCFFITALLAFGGALLVYVLLEESMYYPQAAKERDADLLAPMLGEDAHKATTAAYNPAHVYTQVQQNEPNDEDMEKSATASNNAHTPHTTHAPPVPAKRTSLNPWLPLYHHFSNPRMRALTYPYILSSFTTGLGFIWYIYMSDRYDATPTEVGIYLAFFGVVSVCVQSVGIYQLIPRVWDEQQACVWGYVLQGVQYTAYGLMPWMWGLYGLVAVFSIGLVADPSLKALIVRESFYTPMSVNQTDASNDTTNQHVLEDNYSDSNDSRAGVPPDPQHTQGNLQGALSGVRTLCTALGALLFPTLYSVLPASLAVVVFALAGLMFCVAGACMWMLTVRKEILSKKE